MNPNTDPLRITNSEPRITDPLRLEACAEVERHFAESDRLIAAWLAPRAARRLNVPYVAGLRERRFSWWERLERRAKAEGPRAETDRERAAREYLSPADYTRPSRRAVPAPTLSGNSLMDRVAPDWLGWALILAVGVGLAATALFPGLGAHLKEVLRGVFLGGLLP